MNGVYCFANCMLDKWSQATPVGGIPSRGNVQTDGLLRILQGYPLRLSPVDWPRIETARPPVETVEVAPLTTVDIPAVDLLDIKVLVWSPFADAITPLYDVTSEDWSTFPHGHQALIHGARPLGQYHLTHLIALWRELDRITRHVPRRAVLLYPLDRLDWGGAPRARLVFATAAELLQGFGWAVFSPRAEWEATEPMWSHVSPAAKADLIAEIEAWMVAP